MPGHNYAGPGTHVISRVRRRIRPTTTLDIASLIHDVEYLTGEQFKADNNMWKNIVRSAPYLMPIANNARLAFLAKDLIGYDVPIDHGAYHELKDIVTNEYDLEGMQFADHDDSY